MSTPDRPQSPNPTLDQIQPSSKYPRYWQYKGVTQVLLGGSREDNLFQIADLETELDRVAGCEGNVIRNTMSDRDPGDSRAFAKNADGLYDLTLWNETYWNKFEALLSGTAKRGIMVQIEVWDRFDHSRTEWMTDPWNPANNCNYSAEESGFAAEYLQHPAKNEQPFFFTVPELQNNTLVLSYQQAFVRKMLQHTLCYDHVLYCMDNETLAAEAWGAYWANFIRETTAAAGKCVCLTEMWDQWDVASDLHRNTTDHPERYDFIDLSQNSQITGQANWDNAQVVWQRIASRPRPINSTKIYGNDAHPPAAENGKGTAHAIACFWRNILGGFASSRFHRPSHGLSSGPIAQAQIKMARSFLERYPVFEGSPDSNLTQFTDRNPDSVYHHSIAGKKDALFFPTHGTVGLRIDHLSKSPTATYEIHWLSLSAAEWLPAVCLSAKDGVLLLETPADTAGWVCVIG